METHDWPIDASFGCATHVGHYEKRHDMLQWIRLYELDALYHHKIAECSVLSRQAYTTQLTNISSDPDMLVACR